jgi:hypothetical protein
LLINAVEGEGIRKLLGSKDKSSEGVGEGRCLEGELKAKVAGMGATGEFSEEVSEYVPERGEAEEESDWERNFAPGEGGMKAGVTAPRELPELRARLVPPEEERLREDCVGKSIGAGAAGGVEERRVSAREEED